MPTNPSNYKQWSESFVDMKIFQKLFDPLYLAWTDFNPSMDK